MKKKVLIIYNKIWSYRIKIFEILNEKFDLTVGFIDEKFLDQKFSFKILYLPVKNYGPFTIHKNNLYKIAEKYDVIIGLSDIRWIKLMLLGFYPNRNFKLIYWGIGVRASYNNLFDSKNYWDKVRFFFMKRADALIFYSNYPIKKYIAAGFKKEKLFVAHNTVEAPYDETKEYERKYILFIGTLYQQKGIELLLEAYWQLIDNGFNPLQLNIVGGGSELESIKSWVESHNLSTFIKILGPIYDKDKLQSIFRSSVACISPNQAGLSVLSSMAYGVTFVTKRNAITGGEIFNIIDKKTGLFYDGSIEDLKNKIIMISEKKDEIIKIGENSRKHYLENRTPVIMAQGIIDAINYSLSNKKRND